MTNARPRISFFLISLLLVGGCASSVQQRPVQTSHKAKAEVEGLPPLIPATVPAPNPALSDKPDFDALREAYGQRADYAERCERNRPTKAFMEFVDRKDFDGAVATGVAHLKLCPVDAQFHLYVATALSEQGKKAEAEQHKQWFLGITDSVLKTGDGKSPETAYRTISIAEEYAILLRMGLEPQSQALVSEPFQVDLLTGRDRDGQTRSIYFNPAWHFVRLLHDVMS